MTNEPRNYVGRGKRVKDYDLINITVCLSQLPTDVPFEYKGKQFVKLVVGGKRETDQWGNTHSVWVDTFKPDKNRKRGNPEENGEELNQMQKPVGPGYLSQSPEDQIDEIPF